MAIKLAVFDMAGTTVADDNQVAKCFQQAFSKQGIDIALSDTYPLMGYHKPLAVKMMLEKLGIDTDEDFIDEIHEDFQNEMMDYYEYGPDVKSIEGAEEIFIWLKEKGVRIALNTGFSKAIAKTIIDRLQWKEKYLIDDFIASNEVPAGRPAPYMINELMKRAGIDDPLEVIKIGDTTVDIEEGKNAGCLYVIAISSGANTDEELEKVHPTHQIKNLSEITTILS